MYKLHTPHSQITAFVFFKTTFLESDVNGARVQDDKMIIPAVFKKDTYSMFHPSGVTWPLFRSAVLSEVCLSHRLTPC